MKKLIGNLLILVSLSVIGFIYFPILQAFFPQKFDTQAASHGSYIAIDKIHAYAPIVENVDPSQKSSYEKALQKGVAQAAGFAQIGTHGTTYLFAHSSLPPWEMTRTNTAFLRLGELNIDDSIKLFKDGKEFDYKVVSKQEVSPDQVRLLYGQDAQDRLVLQTCTPIGTDWKRLLIFAVPLKVGKN